MEYTDIRYSDILLCIDSVSARAGELGDGWSPNELCGGEQSHAYHNQAPNWNTIDSLWWNTLTSGTVKLLMYWFCECQSCTMEDGWSSNELWWGRASLMLHNQAPNWNNNWLLVMEYTGHQVQWQYYMYWFCECQSSTTGGQMVSKWMCEESSLMLT